MHPWDTLVAHPITGLGTQPILGVPSSFENRISSGPVTHRGTHFDQAHSTIASNT